MEEKIIRDTVRSIVDPISGGSMESHVKGYRWQNGILTIVLEYQQILSTQEQASAEKLVTQALGSLAGVNAVRVVLTAQETDVGTKTQGAEEKQSATGKKIKHRPNGIGKIILIASGKGGVGKSTVAANLAIALMDQGNSVGLLDADIYGPSIPQLFGIARQPLVEDDLLQPLQQYGIALMSIGFLVPAGTAAVWRGPMVSKALYQLLMQTKWGNLDYLIIDTPPGTGDIHLSLGENYAIDGAVVVTTPQELAVIDAIKALDMFNKLHIPILGVVENMSYLIEAGTGKHIYVFGQSGGRKMAAQHDVPLLIELPIDTSLALASDAGKPLTYFQHNAASTKLFEELAEHVKKAVMQEK